MHDVIVIGGGPTGFATALGLAQAGVDVCLIEAEASMPVSHLPAALGDTRYARSAQRESARATLKRGAASPAACISLSRLWHLRVSR